MFPAHQVFIIKKQLVILITMLSRVSVCNPVHMAANINLNLHMEQNNHLLSLCV